MATAAAIHMLKRTRMLFRGPSGIFSPEDEERPAPSCRSFQSHSLGPEDQQSGSAPASRKQLGLRSRRDMYVESSQDSTHIKAIVRIQLQVRQHLNRKKRINATHLKGRLRYESEVISGTVRLLNFILIFIMLTLALNASSSTKLKAGIYDNLRASFDFDRIRATSSYDSARTLIEDVSDESKKYLVLSHNYFVEEQGNLELVSESTSFAGPKHLIGTDPKVDGQAFTFTAWVQMLEDFRGGYIVRKQQEGAAGRAWEDVTCWGWHLERQAGPGLHFGGHDHFDWDTTSPLHGRVHHDEVSSGRRVEAGGFVLLTVVVSQRNVTFYQDLTHLGTTPLARPVTDCYNSNSALLIGAAGMKIAQLRFYPELLTTAHIEEVYYHGSTLREISTGFSPRKESNSLVEIMEQQIGSQGQAIEVGVREAVEASTRTSLAAGQDDVRNLAAVTDQYQALGMPEGPVLSAAFPFGETAVPNRTQVDATNGREYYLLVPGMVHLSDLDQQASQGGTAPRAFAQGSFPSWRGTGVTFTFWFRGEGSGYLLYANRDGRDKVHGCWGLYMERSGLRLEWEKDLMGPGQDPFVHAQHFLPDAHTHWDHRWWRHMAWQLDDSDDTFRFYLDGVLAYERQLAVGVGRMDCASEAKVVALGHRFPMNASPLVAEVADLRMYVGASDMRAPDLHALAFPDTADPAQRPAPECVQVGAVSDRTWVDAYGHSCKWYRQNRDEMASICEHSEAAQHCPVACGSVQQCLQPDQRRHSYTAWQSIQPIKLQGRNGTLCLGDRQEAAQVLAQCRAWLARKLQETNGDLIHDPDLKPYLAGLVGNGGRRLHLTDCDELAAAIDPHCSFNQDAVSAFSDKVEEAGGDFTIAFWVKSLDTPESLDLKGRFIPQIIFYSSLSPPQHNVMTLSSTSSVSGFELRMESACDPEYVVVEGPPELSFEGWSMITLSRRNHSEHPSGGVEVNELKSDEATGAWRQCTFPGPFFSAVEVSQDMLISPLFLTDGTMATASIQELFYEMLSEIEPKDGPLRSKQEAAGARVRVEKEDFRAPMLLMAPPVIFQMRSDSTDQCPSAFGSELLHHEHESALAERCGHNRLCPPHVIDHVQSVMHCNAARAHGTYFGLNETSVGEQWGFADFLYTMVDSPLVCREDQVLPTPSFIDSNTDYVKVVLIFFSPQYSLTTLMEVELDGSGSKDMVGAVSVRHFEMTQGQNLRDYLLFMYIGAIFQIVLFIDNVRDLAKLWRCYRYRKHTHELAAHARIAVLDLVIQLALLIYLAVRMPARLHSTRNTERVLGVLHSIPWADGAVELHTKITEFLDTTSALLVLMDEEAQINTFANLIMVVLLVRIIIATSMHPRLNLLIGTVGNALDDLWHATVLIVTINCCFAAIATWRFGAERAEFADFTTATYTQLYFIFTGNFTDNWTESPELVLYTMLYTLVSVVLVLNFLLAIVVEAYMTVREANEVNELECEFFTDVLYSFRAAWWQRWRHGWPDVEALTGAMEELAGKQSWGFQEFFATGLFRRQDSCTRFVEHYYDSFPVVRYEVPAVDAETRLVKRFEQRVAYLMKEKPLTHLEEHLAEAPLWTDRRLRSSSKSARSSKTNAPSLKTLSTFRR